MPKQPPLERFDLSNVRRPEDGVLYLYQSQNDCFWHIESDEDIALQEATGYPVGELEELEEYEGDDSEWGELRALFVPELDSEQTYDHRYLRIKEQYPEPLCWLLAELFERNKEYWLEGPNYRRRTIGAESIREHGLTENQRHWANEIKDALESGTPQEDDT